jgi:hypothetical protein
MLAGGCRPDGMTSGWTAGDTRPAGSLEQSRRYSRGFLAEDCEPVGGSPWSRPFGNRQVAAGFGAEPSGIAEPRGVGLPPRIAELLVDQGAGALFVQPHEFGGGSSAGPKVRQALVAGYGLCASRIKLRPEPGLVPPTGEPPPRLRLYGSRIGSSQ